MSGHLTGGRGDSWEWFAGDDLGYLIIEDRERTYTISEDDSPLNQHAVIFISLELPIDIATWSQFYNLPLLARPPSFLLWFD